MMKLIDLVSHSKSRREDAVRKEVVMCILPECPPRDSNPHCIDPKSIASTDWARRASRLYQ